MQLCQWPIPPSSKPPAAGCPASLSPRQPRRHARARAGARSAARGVWGEDIACTALVRDGFTVLGRRMRTKAGEIDVVAERDGLLAFVEVKCRPDLAGAAYALAPPQQARLMAAGEILLAENPAWGRAGVRFDLVLVNRGGQLRRITDVLRQA